MTSFIMKNSDFRDAGSLQLVACLNSWFPFLQHLDFQNRRFYDWTDQRNLQFDLRPLRINNISMDLPSLLQSVQRVFLSEQNIDSVCIEVFQNENNISVAHDRQGRPHTASTFDRRNPYFLEELVGNSTRRDSPNWKFITIRLNGLNTITTYSTTVVNNDILNIS